MVDWKEVDWIDLHNIEPDNSMLALGRMSLLITESQNTALMQTAQRAAADIAEDSNFLGLGVVSTSSVPASTVSGSSTVAATTTNGDDSSNDIGNRNSKTTAKLAPRVEASVARLTATKKRANAVVAPERAPTPAKRPKTTTTTTTMTTTTVQQPSLSRASAAGTPAKSQTPMVSRSVSALTTKPSTPTATPTMKRSTTMSASTLNATSTASRATPKVTRSTTATTTTFTTVQQPASTSSSHTPRVVRYSEVIASFEQNQRPQPVVAQQPQPKPQQQPTIVQQHQPVIAEQQPPLIPPPTATTTIATVQQPTMISQTQQPTTTTTTVSRAAPPPIDTPLKHIFDSVKKRPRNVFNSPRAQQRSAVVVDNSINEPAVVHKKLQFGTSSPRSSSPLTNRTNNVY